MDIALAGTLRDGEEWRGGVEAILSTASQEKEGRIRKRAVDCLAGIPKSARGESISNNPESGLMGREISYAALGVFFILTQS